MTQNVESTAVVAKQPLKGAAAAQAGYDYQLDVSILAALRLLLITKASSRLVLEPANEEDLEADLVPATPGRVQPSATVAGGYKLVVQVKLRGGEPWSIEDFRALLKHGKVRRPALHHLDEPDTRYLLVTSADAKGVARDLLVESFEEPADKGKFPKTLKSTLKKSPAGRVAIWGSLTEKQLASDLRDMMSDLLHVPKPRQRDLLHELRAEAKRRMRGSTPGIWTREDLLATVRKHGGFLASSASLELFVPPANFDQMIKLLNDRGAIVIRGPSGTGKTQAALKLCEIARERDGSLEIVTVGPDDAPASTRKLIDTGPTLFYVEDPWGQYSLRGGSEAWTEQLPRMLEKAGPDHQYVITSRSDMMRSADVGDGLNRWSVELDGDQYNDGPLMTIHDNRMDQLPHDLQAKAFAFRHDALEAFETPLEIDLYFAQMQVGPEEGEQDREFYRRLLTVAHRGAVQDVVGKYLMKIDSSGLAAVVWALLAARSQFDRAQLTALQRVLRRLSPALGDGLEKMVDRLVATRHLRQPARTVAFAHPSVREAFEAFVRSDWPRSEAAIEMLISALVQLSGVYRDWGMETAARALQVSKTLSQRIEWLDPPFDVDRRSQAAIDAWLDEGLLDAKSDFPPLLELASDVGSEGSIPSEVARWLLLGTQRGASVFLKNWAPPNYTDKWYGRIVRDPQSAKIAARFVREELPWDRGHYGRGFPAKLDRIAPDLTAAYVDAALTMVGNGFESNADTIATGAVRDPAAFEPVLEAALDDLAELWRRYAQEGAEEWRAIQDGERDFAAEERHQSHHEGDGYTSGVFVDAYVRQLRSEGEWQKIADHPRVNELLEAWARAIAVSPESPDDAELHAVLQLAQGNRYEHQAWWAARENWRAALAPALMVRLVDSPSETELRAELVTCGLIASPTTLSAAITALTSKPANQLRLLVDVGAARGRLAPKDRAAMLQRFAKTLSSELQEIVGALGFKNRKAKGVGAAALGRLEAIVESLPAETLAAIVPVVIASGGDATQAIGKWLAEAEDNDSAIKATEAAQAIGDHTLLQLALRHNRAEARRLALLALAPKMGDPLPPEILGMANDPGSRVRRALVSVLKDRPHPEHQRVLLSLTTDTWSSAEALYNEPESYPIAREAVEALARYETLTDDVGLQLLALADRTPDRGLSQVALILASHSCGPDIRVRIWAMVNIPESRWIRLEALDALADADLVESDIVSQVTAQLLLQLPVVLAVPATVLLGNHAPVADVVLILERVASSNKRRALLLIGAVTLSSRDLDATRRVLDLLEPNHPARAILDATEPLPVSILDDLGKIRLRRAVRERLGERLAEI